jgi:hypothetical protein
MVRTKNGDLLRTAKDQFDAFLTADQNLQYQQNLSTLPIAVVVLVAKSNRLDDLRPLVPKLLKLLPLISAPALIRLENP